MTDKDIEIKSLKETLKGVMWLNAFLFANFTIAAIKDFAYINDPSQMQGNLGVIVNCCEIMATFFLIPIIRQFYHAYKNRCKTSSKI